MFCTQCGKAAAIGAQFCAQCGAHLQTAIPLSQGPGAVLPAAAIAGNGADAAVPQIRPWVRYWARLFDMYVGAIVIGIVLGILSPGAFDAQSGDQLFGLFVVFAWVFIETLLLSTFGTTPGKWLFRIRLVPPSGRMPDFATALSRSFKVWWRGLGIGFPIATLITLIVAYSTLKKNGMTTWDRDDGFTVLHERIGPARIILAVAFFLGFLMLAVIASVGDV